MQDQNWKNQLLLYIYRRDWILYLVLLLKVALKIFKLFPGTRWFHHFQPLDYLEIVDNNQNFLVKLGELYVWCYIACVNDNLWYFWMVSLVNTVVALYCAYSSHSCHSGSQKNSGLYNECPNTFHWLILHVSFMSVIIQTTSVGGGTMGWHHTPTTPLHRLSHLHFFI